MWFARPAPGVFAFAQLYKNSTPFHHRRSHTPVRNPGATDTMHLPALPYKPLAASLALATTILLAASGERAPIRGPYVLVVVPAHPAPATAAARRMP
jgi:hypothetical protein